MQKIFYTLAIVLTIALILSTGDFESPLLFLLPVALIAVGFAYFLRREVKKEEKAADTISKDVEEILKGSSNPTEKLNEILEETDELRKEAK